MVSAPGTSRRSTTAQQVLSYLWVRKRQGGGQFSAAAVMLPKNQSCDVPPSTTSSDPVMNEASSLARNRAALAISPASPKR